MTAAATPSEHPTRWGGVPYVRDTELAVDPQAVRMLPQDAPGIGVAIAGPVLMVLMPQPPTPAQFRDLERASGMAVTVAVADEAAFAAANAKAAYAQAPGAPRAAAAAFDDAALAGAHDVLLRTGDIPRMRLSGAVVPVGRFPVLSARDVDEAASWLLGQVPVLGTPAHEAVVSHGESRWRVCAYRVQGNLELTARRLPTRVPRLEDVGLPQAVVELASARHGLVLFTGGPGSGKTSSANAMLDRINATRQAHIVTIEDPVEYRHQPMSCAVTQREVGTDVASFAAAVAETTRQSPEVVFIGELRDADSVRAALAAASSGKLVLATLTAQTAEAAVHRIVSAVAEAEQHHVRTQLAACLLAIVAQGLVPTNEPGRAQLVCEVLLATDAVRTLLREGRTHELTAAMENGVRDNLTSFDRSLAYYAAAGRIDVVVAREFATSRDRFEAHLRNAPGTAATPTAPDLAVGPDEHAAAVPAGRARAVPGALGQPQDRP